MWLMFILVAAALAAFLFVGRSLDTPALPPDDFENPNNWL